MTSPPLVLLLVVCLCYACDVQRLVRLTLPVTNPS